MRRTVILILAIAAIIVMPAIALPGAVAPGYARAEAKTRTLGRAAVALIAAGKADALYSRFGSSLAQLISQEKFVALARALRPFAAHGVCKGEAILPKSLETRVYTVDYRYKGQTLAFQFSFDRNDQISWASIKPRLLLLPDPNAKYDGKTLFCLPFTETWWTFWGGDTVAQNYHIIASDQRDAYDFCIWKNGGTHQGDGTHNTDYWAWGRPVIASADGRVIEAVGDIPDNTPGTMNPAHPFGNHLIMDCGNGEYLVLGHFQQCSVQVHAGELVKSGQALARCGNSGNSSEPHLHIHLQDTPTLFGAARGLPLSFTHYVLDGEDIDAGDPIQGQFVAPRQSNSRP